MQGQLRDLGWERVVASRDRARRQRENSVNFTLRAQDRALLLQCLFALWRYARRSGCRRGRRGALLHFERWRLRAAFRAFAAASRGCGGRRQRAAQAEAHRGQWLSGGAFRGWAALSRHARAVRECYTRIMRRSLDQEWRDMHAAVLEWRDRAAARAQAVRVCERLHAVGCGALRRASFAAWAGRAARGAATERKARAALAARRARAALQAWRSEALGQRALGAQLQRLRARQGRVGGARALRAWANVARSKAFLRAKGRVVVAALRGRGGRAASCFTSWAILAGESRRSARLGAQLRAATRARRLRACFVGFERAVRLHRAERRTGGARRRALLRRSLEAWKTFGRSVWRKGCLLKYSLRRVNRAALQGHLFRWSLLARRAGRGRELAAALRREADARALEDKLALQTAQAAEWQEELGEVRGQWQRFSRAFFQPPSGAEEGRRGGSGGRAFALPALVSRAVASLSPGGGDPLQLLGTGAAAPGRCVSGLVGVSRELSSAVARRAFAGHSIDALELARARTFVCVGGFDLEDRTSDVLAVTVGAAEGPGGTGVRGGTQVGGGGFFGHATPLAPLSGTAVGPRSDHCTCALPGDEVLVIGGTNGQKELADVHLLSVALVDRAEGCVAGYRHEELLSHAQGKAHFRRSHFSAVGVQWEGYACLAFGGFNRRHGLHNDVWGFSLDRREWDRILVTGVSPSPRRGHSAVLMGRRMLVFGGTDGKQDLNDVHALNLDTWAWEGVAAAGAVPSPRRQHAACARGGCMVVDGGISSAVGLLDDSFSLDLESGTWHRLAVRADGRDLDGTSPGSGARCLHSVAPYGDGFVTLGGLAADGAPRAGVAIVSAPALCAEATQSAAAAAAVQGYLEELPSRDEARLAVQALDRELASARAERDALRERLEAESALHAEAVCRGEEYQGSLRRILEGERRGARAALQRLAGLEVRNAQLVAYKNDLKAELERANASGLAFEEAFARQEGLQRRMQEDRRRSERRWREKAAAGAENLRLAGRRRAALEGHLSLQQETLAAAQAELEALKGRLAAEQEAARGARAETVLAREALAGASEEHRAAEAGLHKRLSAADLALKEAQARLQGLLDRNAQLQEQGEQLRRESWRAQAARQDALAEAAAARRELDGAEPHPLVAAQLEGRAALERRERELEAQVSLLQGQAAALREAAKDAEAERDVALRMKREAYASVQELQSALLSEFQQAGELEPGGLIRRFQAHVGASTPPEAATRS